MLQPKAPASPGRAGVLASRVLRESGIGLALLAMVAFFAVVAPQFTAPENIANILTQITINLILATGMTFAVLIGGIDLSVGAVMAPCAVMARTVLKLDALSEPAAIGLGILASLVTGMICGGLNGFISSF